MFTVKMNQDIARDGNCMEFKKKSISIESLSWSFIGKVKILNVIYLQLSQSYRHNTCPQEIAVVTLNWSIFFKLSSLKAHPVSKRQYSAN